MGGWMSGGGGGGVVRPEDNLERVEIANFVFEMSDVHCQTSLQGVYTVSPSHMTSQINPFFHLLLWAQ